MLSREHLTLVHSQDEVRPDEGHQPPPVVLFPRSRSQRWGHLNLVYSNDVIELPVEPQAPNNISSFRGEGFLKTVPPNMRQIYLHADGGGDKPA